MLGNNPGTFGNTNGMEVAPAEGKPEHDLFIQSMKLKNTLRHLMGEDVITHLGLDYYDSIPTREDDHARI